MFSRLVSKVGSKSNGSRKYSNIIQQLPNQTKVLAVAGLIGASAALYFAVPNQASASFGYAEENLPPPAYPWDHKSLWKSFDHASIRRGFLVYNTVGSSCHSMKFRYYRQLVDVAFTEDEMKEFAASHEDYPSQPNEEGEVLERPGVLNDKFWSAYKNDREARFLNNGALPPDLSQIVRARHGGEDYIMALLTGYRDPPHGVKLGENMYYNLYMPGSQIAMPPPLKEGAIEYDDGTEASVSQMAKDVATFLAWSSFMEQDERHLMGLKTLTALSLLCVPFFYFKKFRFSTFKHRGVAFLRRGGDGPSQPHH